MKAIGMKTASVTCAVGVFNLKEEET